MLAEAQLTSVLVSIWLIFSRKVQETNLHRPVDSDLPDQAGSKNAHDIAFLFETEVVEQLVVVDQWHHEESEQDHVGGVYRNGTVQVHPVPVAELVRKDCKHFELLSLVVLE